MNQLEESEDKKDSIKQEIMLANTYTWPLEKRQALAKVVVLLASHITFPLAFSSQCQLILSNLTSDTDFEPRLKSFKDEKGIISDLSYINFGLDHSFDWPCLTLITYLIYRYLSGPNYQETLSFLGILDKINFMTAELGIRLQKERNYHFNKEESWLEYLLYVESLDSESTSRKIVAGWKELWFFEQEENAKANNDLISDIFQVDRRCDFRM